MTRSYDSGPIFERNRVIDKVAVDFQSVRGFAQDLAYFWGSDGGLVAQFRGIVEAIDAIFEEIYQIRNAVYDSTPIARYFMGEAVNDVVERMEKVIDCEFEARYRKLQSGLWERFSAALQRFSIDVDVKDWGALSEDLGRVTEVCDWCGRVRAQMRHRTAAWEKKVQRVPEEVCDVVSEYMSAYNYVAGVRTLRTGITELPKEMARIKAELKKARELEYVVLRRVSYDVLLQQAQAQEETKKQLIKERKAREEKQRELHEIVAEVVFACKNARFADLHVAMETFVEDKELGDGRFQGTLQVNGKRKVVEVIRSPKTQELINRIKQLVLVSHPAILPVLGWSCDSTMFSFATAPMQTTLESLLTESPPLFDATKRCICAVGIAAAMDKIYARNRVYGNLSSRHVLLDDHFYPFVDVGDGGTADEAADIYSYGLILRDLYKPFESKLTQAHQSLISSCLSPDPTKRPRFHDLQANPRSLIIKCNLGLVMRYTKCVLKLKAAIPAEMPMDDIEFLTTKSSKA